MLYFLGNSSKNKDIWAPESKESMNISYLLIGGNEGDRRGASGRQRESRLRRQRVRSGSLFPVRDRSLGKGRPARFLNQALQIDTSAEPTALMKTLLGIEETMGRKRLEKYGLAGYRYRYSLF